MSQFIFKQAGYSYATTQLEGAKLAQEFVNASPNWLQLKIDDPIKVDTKAGVIQRVAENQSSKIEALMIYNKDSDSYLTVDDAKYKAHKGEKFHRSVGYIVSMLTNKSEFAKVTDKAKRNAINDVRESVRMYSNNVMSRLDSQIKKILEPSDTGSTKQAEAFKVWSDNELKGIEARRLTSEGRGDIVPPKEWLEKEVLIPARAKLKEWYAKNDK
jgi:hypothetical protein